MHRIQGSSRVTWFDVWGKRCAKLRAMICENTILGLLQGIWGNRQWRCCRVCDDWLSGCLSMLIGWKFYCIQIIYLLGCLALFHEFKQSGSLFFRLARGLTNRVRVGLYLYSKFRNQETANGNF